MLPTSLGSILLAALALLGGAAWANRKWPMGSGRCPRCRHPLAHNDKELFQSQPDSTGAFLPPIVLGEDTCSNCGFVRRRVTVPNSWAPSQLTRYQRTDLSLTYPFNVIQGSLSKFDERVGDQHRMTPEEWRTLLRQYKDQYETKAAPPGP